MKLWAECILLASAAVAGCSGDSTSGDGGTDATTGPDAPSGTDASSDAGSDAAPQPDGCVPVEGGLACDPGHVTCGAASCDVTKQFCCLNDGGAVESCLNDPPDSGGPPPPNNCNTGTKAFCDEAADCPSGQICCGFVGGGGGFATACAPSCGTGLQFCRGSAECKSGSCVAQTCRGEAVETCGTFCP